MTLTTGALIAAIGLGGALLYKLIQGVALVQKMSTTLNLIIDNHLPHLQEGLKKLREDFIRHLEHGRN